MFASKTLTEHVVRGVLGASALVTSVVLASSHPILSVALLPLALVALRGCPMCWTIGLAQTLAAKLQGRTTVSGCGPCATERSTSCRR